MYMDCVCVCVLCGSFVLQMWGCCSAPVRPMRLAVAGKLLGLQMGWGGDKGGVAPPRFHGCTERLIVFGPMSVIILE